MNCYRLYFCCFWVAVLLVPGVGSAQAETPLGSASAPPVSAPPPVPVVPAAPVVSGSGKPFATVGDEVIAAETYTKALAQGMRQKFYHGRVPDDVLAKFQREIGKQLVEKVLFLKEIKRRGIKPDSEAVAKTIAEYEKRYADAPRWRADREKMLPGLTAELEAQSLLGRLEQAVRVIPEPKTAEVLAYYEANPDKFTEPMDQKVSLILLKVDPSAGGAAWDSARGEAGKLVEKLKSGAGFEELARIHSGDRSASDGGKLGYTHQGMLSEEVEQALAKIKPGEITEPVMVLEGIAIFRLESRTPQRKVSFEMAKERATGLLMREQSQSTWEKFKKQLWETGQVAVNEAEFYIPLTPDGEKDGKADLHGKGSTQKGAGQ